MSTEIQNKLFSSIFKEAKFRVLQLAPLGLHAGPIFSRMF